ncbi:MAG: tRNA pseudouridine(38-40) synthase TruA [Cohaesibacteraceae bacterium]|nr:tRNA pseudouridine(38-40) synthase TruA [Cohaesibacteraceae bacterium]
MKRYKLTIEYAGTGYCGWQRQPNAVTIQQRIEEAIAKFSGQNVRIFGAGRTDAGVHAIGQVAHMDLDGDWKCLKLREAINHFLKTEQDRISILLVENVDDEFDARFSATRRHYKYIIRNRRSQLTFERDRVWHVSRELDVSVMQDAAQRLTGLHDFTTFRSVDCQAKSPVKTIDRLDVERNGEYITIYATARSFMHNQIRSFVGTIAKAGDGRWTANDVEKALIARDRLACGPVAPPDGLYFIKVDY